VRPPSRTSRDTSHVIGIIVVASRLWRSISTRRSSRRIAHGRDTGQLLDSDPAHARMNSHAQSV